MFMNKNTNGIGAINVIDTLNANINSLNNDNIINTIIEYVNDMMLLI